VSLADDYNKFLRDAAEQMDMTGNLYLAPDEDGGLPTIVKSAAYIPVSFEHLIDAGAMTEEEARARGWEPTVYPPIPRRIRLRWWIAVRRIRLGRRVGSWIAGERLYSDDEMYDDE
jgi:hypothetical protein